MLRINNLIFPESLDDAYKELIKNKNNCILGGMIWLKMEDRIIPTGIDLSKLNLNKIEETQNAFKIGAMVTLRELETSLALNRETCYIFKESVQDIVGVQLRNMATIGGSVFSRFGFSDVICALLCLDTEVCLYKHGIMPLQKFLDSGIYNDILTHIIIPKKYKNIVFTSFRNTATDLPILNVSISKDDAYHICVGARPAIAKRFDMAIEDIQTVADKICEKIICGSNMRASKEYRYKLMRVLVSRMLRKVDEQDENRV